MKILITGGAGFIGLNLATNLAKQGHEVVLVDNFFRGRRDADLEKIIQLPNVTLITADLTKLSDFEKIGAGYDHVYHLAAVNGTRNFYERPAEVLRIDTLTTLYMLEWMRDKNPKGKFLFTSSNEAYAGLETLGKLPIPTPENVPLIVSDVWNPRWSYGGTKLIGELLVINYGRQYNFPFVIVRPHNFYGPRAGFDHVIPQFLRRIYDSENPFAIFGAEETRSFCYIDDATRAMILTMNTNECQNQIIHIGTTEETKIGDLALMMFDLFDFHPQVEIKSAPEGSVKRRLADVAKLQKLTGWQQGVSLREGLKKTQQWYEKQFKNQDLISNKK